jgi:hypothetical protein
VRRVRIVVCGLFGDPSSGACMCSLRRQSLESITESWRSFRGRSESYASMARRAFGAVRISSKAGLWSTCSKGAQAAG